MGFNRRKMEDERRRAAAKEAATGRATDAQILEDAERLIAAWNERQVSRKPIGAKPAANPDHEGLSWLNPISAAESHLGRDTLTHCRMRLRFYGKLLRAAGE
jgi:hypothetical protein